ncbi:hypothetical protein NCS52_00426000 [Fusarium sp. LHS14.1]|nr:hypothetical protein NCS52_00426000 [Fusarium sp. LHS14.1]
MGCETMVSSGTSLGPQNCYAFSQGHSEMLSPTQAAFQTAALAYHSTPDSGVNHGNGSLTLRWLDLLIGDATLNYGPLPELDIGLSGPDVFGNTVTQTPTSLDEAATPATNDSSGVTTQSAYLQERLPDRRGPSSDKQFWQASEAIALQPQEHILFRHFTEHISRWMDLFEPQRPFGTLVPHLALHNIGLMNAVLALSARHLRIVNSDSPCHAAGYRPDPNDTIRYYWKTLHYSQKAMKYETYQTSLELLASAIIISSYEMLDGASTNWEKHLKGVFWIQRSAVYNFAHIVGFCAEESELGNATLNTQKAALLLQRLETWKSYLTVEFNPLPGPDSEDSKDFPLLWIQPAAFAKRIIALSASLAPCYGGFKEYLERQKTLKKWARMVCGIAMTCTDYAASVMSSQCVFIAGMVIEDDTQRDAVLEYLDTCNKRAGWPGYSLGRELKDIWRAD